MARPRQEPELPACYAMVIPGLETLAAEEIEQRLRGDVKRTGQGVVVFRAAQIDKSVLELRTTEDIFLLAWGSDQLSYRAEDLERIRRWTDRDAAWEQLLKIHHAIRPKPKGKPTFRLVVQMSGQHGYRRVDARKALARGLAGKLPASWRHAEENAAVEIWLTIHGATAVCGLRLSDRSMRHRTYKLEHRPASLRPTLAAAMVRLADVRPGLVVLDPMCGVGTILSEVVSELRNKGWRHPEGAGRETTSDSVLGGDIETAAVRAAVANLSRFDNIRLTTWDARQLPLPVHSVDRILCNLPFGKQLAKPEEIPRLYRKVLPEMDRVLRPGGRAVLLVAEAEALKAALGGLPWKQTRFVRVRILGQPATIFVFRKLDS